MSAKKIKGIVIPRRLKWSTSAGGEGMNSTPSPSGGGIAFFALALNAARYSRNYLPDAQTNCIETTFKEVTEHDRTEDQQNL